MAIGDAYRAFDALDDMLRELRDDLADLSFKQIVEKVEDLNKASTEALRELQDSDTEFEDLQAKFDAVESERDNLLAQADTTE